MSQSLQIHTYYLDLMELTVALLFVVVLKVVMLLGMQKLSGVLSDDDDRRAAGIPVKQKHDSGSVLHSGTSDSVVENGKQKKRKKLSTKPRLSGDLNRVRWGLVVVLAVAALWQVRPYTLFVTPTQLIAIGSFPGVAHWWVNHSLWLNIWSIIIELTFAALLASFHSPKAIRFFAIVFFIYSIVVWVFLQGFGGVMGSEPSFLFNLPGTAVLLSVAVLPLCVQGERWKRMLPWVLSVYWLLFCIAQWLPQNKFWSGHGYERLAGLVSQTLPSPLQNLVSSSLTGMSKAGVLVTVLVGLMALALSVAHIWFRGRLTFMVSVVVLGLIWVFVQGLGFGSYAFSCGTALAVGLIEWMAFSVKR